MAWRPAGTVALIGGGPASLSRLRPPGVSLPLAPSAARSARRPRKTDGRPQEEEVQGQGPQPPRRRLAPRGASPQRLPPLQLREAAPRGLRQLWLVRRPRGRRGRLNPVGSAERRVGPMLPIAIDAMGGDHAPGAIVEGARRAANELGVPVVLVGRPEDLNPLRGDLDVVAASQVIGMDADAGSSVRTMKDSSLVRAAEAVRDGRAAAMVSAGNTGATMASALLRLGRIKGVARPAIATPIPVPGSTPTVLLDAGANAECQPQWLVQFAQMGATFARERYRIAEPRVGLLSIGEEPTKGNALVKETHGLLGEAGVLDRAGARFVGNVEGRDIMTPDVDVVVTDGFTGNVALKTLEGGLRSLVTAVVDGLSATDVADAALGALMPLYAALDPDQTGGAMLLGVDGVCIISHGSSSATAVVNATRVAAEMVEAGVVERLRSAVASA